MEIMWRVDKLKDTIEVALLNKIKIIGDNEQTYFGYPSSLISDIAFAIDQYLKDNRI